MREKQACLCWVAWFYGAEIVVTCEGGRRAHLSAKLKRAQLDLLTLKMKTAHFAACISNISLCILQKWLWSNFRGENCRKKSSKECKMGAVLLLKCMIIRLLHRGYMCGHREREREGYQWGKMRKKGEFLLFQDMEFSRLFGCSRHSGSRAHRTLVYILHTQGMNQSHMQELEKMWKNKFSPTAI